MSPRTQTGRASADPTGRWAAHAWAQLAARSAVTIGAAPVQEAQGVAGVRRVRTRVAAHTARRVAAHTARRVAAHTARRVAARTARLRAAARRAAQQRVAARTAQQVPARTAQRRAVGRTARRRAAARTARGLLRSRVGGRKLAERPAVALRTPVALQQWAKPWLRMDSSPQARQSGRVRRGRSGQRRRDQPRSGCWRSTAGAAGVAGAAARRRPVEGAAANPRARRRTQAEPGAAAAVPKRPEAGVAAAAERAARRGQEGELPRRPMGYRRTDKTCWWAGSTRRTACTRSCEKLPSSAVPRSRARPSAASIPALPHHYAVKGGKRVQTHGALGQAPSEVPAPTNKTGLNSPFSPGVGSADTAGNQPPLPRGRQ